MTGLTTTSDSTDLWTPEISIPPELLGLPAPLSFFHILRYLKTQRRTGWLVRGVNPQNAESIADHMYRMAVMCLLAPNDQLDSRKCAVIALVHDLAEAVVGDLTPEDPVGPVEKHRRERETMKYLASLVKPLNEEASILLNESYLEYENQSSAEARFVKDLDKFEFLLQTVEYEKDVLNGVESKDVVVADFMYAVNLVKHPLVKEWTKQLTDERKSVMGE